MPTALQRFTKTSVKLVGTIPAGNTLDIDTEDYSSFTATNYLIALSKPTTDVVKSLVLHGFKKNTDVSDQIYSRGGDALDVSVNLVKEGTDIHLRLVNNESFDVDASILKFLF